MSSTYMNYKKEFHPDSADTRRLTFKATGGISFQYFWSLKNTKIKWVWVAILSITSGALNYFLVEKAGIFSPGMQSIWQSIARLVKGVGGTQDKTVYVSIFWGLNAITNIGLSIATVKAIGKGMTQLSVIYIIGSALTGVALSYIPSSDTFYIFSNPFKGQQQSGQQSNGESKFLIWEHITCPASQPQSQSQSTTIGNGILVLFMYAITFSLLNSIVSSLLYAMGGCGGGVDWIIFYLFKTRSYFANKLMFYAGIGFSSFSYIVGSYIPWAVSCKQEASVVASNFFSPMFFAMILAILVRRVTFNLFYPRFKFVNVKIFTNMYLEIRQALIDVKFPHSFTIVPSFGSYRLKSQAQLEFICLLIELQELVKIVRSIDKNCFICSMPIRSLNARINM
ncbi:hypothetical protein MHLP_00105 [Candidatus Mycoplasma haematolamae str. Purdue]|uniref:DUF2179 domain-containing protein n=1 Tax=Mycoplasma haematolamae (strain Purdue) TaxID=1212765 RepID=I7CEE3_MYCHA|nr:DUF2179 domain-containing protein [Candidatus Mycoplasma haematolamae]AFO51601.1 hypothetical protein MHLP_00105 [Candidatus Mycoplasma haematolamae str. Purdue]